MHTDVDVAQPPMLRESLEALFTGIKCLTFISYYLTKRMY